jgi:transglutaminase-like putative cysteine protease
MRYGLRVSEPIVRLARRYLARAGRLSPPAEAASRYRRYLRNFTIQTEILLAETRIMETGAFAAGKGLEGRKRHLAHASDALARALGLPDCVGDGSGKSAGTAA